MEPAVEDPPELDNRSSRRTKFFAVVALVAIVAYAVTRPSNEPSFQAAGEPVALPQAGHLTDMSETQFEGVLVGLRGTPVIVNIWASWCSPCRTETPLLERTWKAHSSDVVIIGVA
ncbi:MAG: TlpA disulfide reductase family protein, partial [Ilumatobacteraceae bacterium]